MNILNWLENHFLPCAYKHFSGFECPFCGWQRALIALLKGDVMDSIRLYPALIPTIILITLAIMQVLFKWNRGWKTIRVMLKADFAIIMISYFYKLIFVN
jgi:hypothetical protein